MSELGVEPQLDVASSDCLGSRLAESASLIWRGRLYPSGSSVYLTDRLVETHAPSNMPRNLEQSQDRPLGDIFEPAVTNSRYSPTGCQNL
ncbi:hypothetical protein LIER_35289 [Lithospermum erythrorhizon]|uniref:Uncharacterized protein n=1 Tax=Lithospermum erythrorhizon TaxID=34254 RepID=A0AAV3NNP8_LITER